MNKTLIFHENSHIDLNASFAPGTYRIAIRKRKR